MEQTGEEGEGGRARTRNLKSVIKHCPVLNHRPCSTRARPVTYYDIRCQPNTFTCSQRQIDLVGAQAIEILMLRILYVQVNVFMVFISSASETLFFYAARVLIE